MTDYSTYQSPLNERYASKEMLHLFSMEYKITTWRKLWISLAKGQQHLGLPITHSQIKELEDNINPINFQKALEYEKQFRHDVMAHIHTYGDACPKAKSIIHLGATSCYVTDNADIIQMQEALNQLKEKLVHCINNLSKFAEKEAHTPCLGYTHFQPAQPTTLGKRTCIWLQDLLIDLQELEYRQTNLRFLGVKGTTGTQASFLSLFKGDHNKVIALDDYVSQEMGFKNPYIISGQTYTRKQDSLVTDSLAGLASSIHKFGSDLRLLAHLKEVEEPFEKKQIGSSAMPYKRNPMRSERLCALSRILISLSENPKYTHSQQWLERTLDDSANRRIVISEAFLLADSLLNILYSVTNGLVSYPKMMLKHLKEELPFMATETILMKAVENGGDRQEIHELIRKHSIKASQNIKEHGKENDLIQRLANDPSLPLSLQEIDEILNIKKFIGRSPQQVELFLKKEIFPLTTNYQNIKPISNTLTV
jgi:adenylosuccinate lyase